MEERRQLLGLEQDNVQQSSKRIIFLRRSVLLFVISLALISKGILTSIAGPTLQYVARNTNSSVGAASYVISGLSLGICIGAVTMSYLKSTKRLLSTGINLLLSSISIALTPFVHSLALLVVLRAIAGFTIGYYATGLLSIYQRKWGKVGSRPIMQLHTLMFSFGAFLAPIIAKSFLEMERHEEYPAVKCRFARHDATSQRNGSNISDVNSPSINVLNDSVGWMFWVVGGYIFALSMAVFVLDFYNVLDKIPDEYDDVTIESETKEEMSAKETGIFVTSLFLFYFCLTGLQNLFGGYIYSIAVCSDIAMNVSQASLFNSVYWAGLITSRVLATFMAKNLNPANVLTADFIGIISALIAMSIWGERVETVSWIGTFAVGFFSGTLFASGISWSSTVIRTDGKYGFVFYSGGNVGTVLLTPLGGVIFHVRPFAVVYLMTGVCAVMIIFFLVMMLVAWYSDTK